MVPTKNLHIAKQLDKQEIAELVLQQPGIVRCVVNIVYPW